MDDREILNILATELSNCDNKVLDADIEKSLTYYLGNPRGDEKDGRSKVISTDVADSIEWLMPQIIKEFTQSSDIVAFDAISEGDEDQAALESDYVASVLMRDNDGFQIIHSLVKDALLHKNGVCKVYFENELCQETSEYSGITQDQLNLLAARPDVQITALSEEPYMDEIGQTWVQYSVKCVYSSYKPKICIESVPIEQFRISSNYNSINPDSAPFTAHLLQKSRSDLLKEGFDPDILRDIPTSTDVLTDIRFNAQNEYVSIENSNDRSTRLIEIAECYMQIDVNDDGIAERVKITAACSDNNPTKILSVEEVDYYPFVATTGILMSHKFRGLSIYDRIKSIQDQKTALLRNILDNLYLTNNRVKLVLENKVELNDILTSANIVRVRDMNAVAELPTQGIGQEPYQMLEYLDQIRAGRTGVSAEGSASPQEIGGSIGSEGVDRLMTAKEELAGLIVRTIAETGIKPLFTKIRCLLVKHIDVVKDYKFRGNWAKIQPKTWPPRHNSTVRVGIGTGDKRNQIAAIQAVMQLQEKMMSNPATSVLIDRNKAFTTINDFCKLSGLTGANRYFVDPTSEQGQQSIAASEQSQAQQAEQQKQLEMMQLQMQQKLSDSAMQTAQAQIQSVQARFETDQVKAQLQEQKQFYESQIKRMEQELTQIQHDSDLKFKYDELEAKTAIELEKLNRNTANAAKNLAVNAEILEEDDETDNDTQTSSED